MSDVCLLTFQRETLDNNYKRRYETHADIKGLLVEKTAILLLLMRGDERVGEAETYLGEKWEDDRGGCARQPWLAEKVDAR